MEEKRKPGRPAGSRNKNPAQGRKKFFQTVSISGTPEEIEKVKALAEKCGKTVSRFLLDLALNTN
jgi:hypothetical protein